MDTASQLARWERVYSRAFGIELGEVDIPTRAPDFSDFSRLIVVTEGLATSRAFEALSGLFSTWSYHSDLDSDVTENERTPETTYAIWVRDVVEADDDLKYVSACDIRDRGLATETLLERLLHELVYYTETGRSGHLDSNNHTLCAGSRYSGAGYPRVPSVRWNAAARQFCVDSVYHDIVSSDLRARAVVS